MNWFEEQIKQRIKTDNEMLTDAVAKMVNLVSVEKIIAGSKNRTDSVYGAICDILKYYHIKPQEFPDDITDTDELLEYMLRPAGIMRRRIKLTKGWHKDAIYPMIGTNKSGEIVSVIPGSTGGFYYGNSRSDDTVKVTSFNEGELNEEAICFYQSLPLRKMDFKDLLKFMFSQLNTGDIAWIIAATLIATLSGMAIPVITKYLYSDVLKVKNTSLLGAAIMTLLCITLASGLVTAIRTMIVTNITTRISLATESAIMMRILSLPANFFRQFTAGELAGRISNVNGMCSALFNSLFSSGITAVFSLVYIGQIFAFAPALCGPALAIMISTFVITVVMIMYQMKITEEQLREAGREEGMVYSLISGVPKLKNAGAEKRAFAKWSDQYVKAATYLYDPPVILRLGETMITAVMLTGSIVMYFFAIRSNVTVADYMAFTSAYGMVSGAFTALSTVMGTIAMIRPVIKLIQPVFDAEPEIEAARKVVTGLRGGIELNNVSFRYEDNAPYVIDDMTLKIKPGQYVAIVGKTGCGKSTLMRILLGFEKPCKGAVYYDGQDISLLDLRSLRRHIGVVMQNSSLFSGDIFSNITISNPNLTLDDAWDAAAMAGMDEDIRKMPMGMNTVISEGSGGISGGQRQRLMIARAVAPKPKILMFDEATSALDNITQKIVSDSLDSLKCTRIVIAHRLSTIRHCDRILVLDSGRIIEDGTFDELLAAKGYFAQLVERQLMPDREA